MNEGMNKVLLLGNLGADPELRWTTAGTAVMSFRMATNETWADKNQERQERTEWHSVVVWGNRAEALSKVLTKGTSVLVEGVLRTSSYEKDGVKRYKTEIHARDVFFTGKRATSAGSDAAGPGPAKAARNGAPSAEPPIDELPF